jgi:AraC-like DNA-binding protein
MGASWVVCYITGPGQQEKTMATTHANDGSFPSPPIRQHFSTHDEPPHRQLLSMRERVSHILDMPISRTQMADGFRGTIDSYRVKDLLFLDCITDPLQQTRSVARISTDAVRDYVFHIMLEGTIETRTGLYPQRKSLQSRPGILALDMNQPMHMNRPACRVMAFFLPRAIVESVVPDGEAIHGRVIEYTSPLSRMIPAHLAALTRDLPAMSAKDGYQALESCAYLIAAAFGKEARLSGNARAAARAALFGTARRYIDENLHHPDLSPESVLKTSHVSRPTLYRLFEHEGGLSTYIRNRRLREAADELLKFPHKAVIDIAYGLGFKSASDFNHAFRRAYDMTPVDFRSKRSGKPG